MRTFETLAQRYFRTRKVTSKDKRRNYGQSTKQACKIWFKNIQALLHNHSLGVELVLVAL